MIIAFTGEKLAGKTTATNYLVEKCGASSFRFSQPLTDILHRLGKENSRQNLVAIGGKLREIFGNDILGQILLTDLQASSAKYNVIDGLRYIEEYELLKTLPDFKLVYITSPIEERYARTRGRSEKTDEANMTIEMFKQKENDSTEKGITDLASHADSTIQNVGRLDEFYTSVQTLVNVTD